MMGLSYLACKESIQCATLENIIYLRPLLITQSIVDLGLRPDSIAAHVAALAQLSKTEAAKRKSSQAVLKACEEVLSAALEGFGNKTPDQKVIAALYTVSKVDGIMQLMASNRSSYRFHHAEF